ncbi:hypothetical protein HanPI659440_Chr14g0543601 [Helianthus annuus]|nr:hypothetical protein HanPI659440_Chr14g0543601 [Helianthus annuus]
MLIFADHCRPCIHLTKSSRRTSGNYSSSPILIAYLNFYQYFLGFFLFVIELQDTNTDNDDDSDPNYVESMDDESNDVSSLFDDSDSDVVSTDGMSDEDDEQDRDSPDYHKVDPDYHPIEFRLIVDVALASRIDMTMKMCVQNLSDAEKKFKTS